MNKVVPQEILDQLLNLKKKKDGLSKELGEIVIAIDDLENRKRTALNYRLELLEEENTLVEFLSNQYGNGTLNTETGEFQPFTE